mmetsp:Transcript_19512/g.37371  ORF Transcript_19512/g.37371 Transcript_19512/m.37371 type:complete len:389 (-) Transcript_19512:387-1553(-)|eukprot:CAMPEP_0114229912 /NCGR_PEP_ID=MMETSP0058-20121206/3177_1 /TAXON_ID=36894 /ORGANISM="Pyramimonas parkeae, CCMP726" /LENGTH=388 /DNA_ID=CAMNT_0001341053 /DNA_START=93 /DNA_END=1259 /DNA_ORIENTATION=+
MEASQHVPAPTTAEVLACSFPQWASTFKPYAFRNGIIPLKQDFLDYLQEDGVFLPHDSAAMPKRQAQDPDETPWTDEEDDSGVEVPLFTELKQEIRAAIDALGGEVVPKLNWSSPKDAVWVSSTGSMKCTQPDEVLLLLKSSDAVIHDLCHVFDNCCDSPAEPKTLMPAPVLVLKKWYDLRPSSEFRCFVRHGEYIGACQRDTARRYPFLSDMKQDLEEVLLDFFEMHVLEAFPSQSYTYDVYVTESKKVKIMDFNPYGGETLPLLFEWSELEAMAARATHAASAARHLMGKTDSGKECVSLTDAPGDSQSAAAPAGANASDRMIMEVEFVPELRLLTQQQQIRPGLRTGVPLDLYDTSDTGALAEFFNRAKEEHDAEQECVEDDENL